MRKWIIILCILLVGVGIWLLCRDGGPSVENNSVYRLKLEGTLVEQAQPKDWTDEIVKMMPYGQSEETVGLNEILHDIRVAKTNEDICGIYLDGGELSMGPAQAVELRRALLDFKQSGKWIIAYAHNYGTYNYYVASVADSIYLNPTGGVQWHGCMAAKMYYTRLLEKLGVEVQIVKVGTFKSAVEPFFRTSMSDADRVQTKRYIDGIWSELVSGVSQSRGISAEALNTMADSVLELRDARDYKAFGIVDSLVYDQAMEDILKARCGDKKPHYLSTDELAQIDADDKNGDDVIAVVYAEGDIADDAEDGIGGKQFVKLLDKIRKDDDVKAVVLRVCSPGGSADASEQIYHAEQLIREKGIPLVVSMSTYAASGGYYISSPADYIYAEPTTITGSIGIFGMIPSFKGLRDKVGLDIDGIQTNLHSLMETNMLYNGMTPEEMALVQRQVNRGYELFTSRCAEGRHISQDSVKAIGSGRVWLGTDALALGLVDSLGNMDDAIAKAAALASLSDYSVVCYPKPKTMLEQLLERSEPASEEERLLLSFKRMLSAPRVLTRMPYIMMENQ